MLHSLHWAARMRPGQIGEGNVDDFSITRRTGAWASPLGHSEGPSAPPRTGRWRIAGRSDGRRITQAGINADQLCTCAIDGYMRATPVDQLKREQGTAAPAGLASATQQCVMQMMRQNAGGATPAANEAAAAEAPPAAAEENAATEENGAAAEENSAGENKRARRPRAAGIGASV